MSKFARFRDAKDAGLSLYIIWVILIMRLHFQLVSGSILQSGAEIPLSKWALLDILANTLAGPYHAT